jgi:hypothetical protein
VLVLLVNVILTAAGVEMPGTEGFSRELPPGVNAAILVTSGVLQVGLAILMWVGATRMARLQSWGLSLAAAIAALLPCSCCCILGLPLGIWAIVILAKPDVKAAFTS